MKIAIDQWSEKNLVDYISKTWQKKCLAYILKSWRKKAIATLGSRCWEVNPLNLSNPPSPMIPSNPLNRSNPLNPPSPSNPLYPSHPPNPCPHAPNPRFKDSPLCQFYSFTFPMLFTENNKLWKERKEDINKITQPILTK